jgi:hypothetical protein
MGKKKLAPAHAAASFFVFGIYPQPLHVVPAEAGTPFPLHPTDA